MMAYVAKTNEQWLAKVAENEEDLLSLIRDWHPVSRLVNHRSKEFVAVGVGEDVEMIEIEKARLPITAYVPEAACQTIREEIIRKEHDQPDPVERFKKAMAKGDISEIMGLLSSAWFGVPESTGCWSIPGFGVACDLMDDPPEPEGGQQESEVDDDQPF